MINYKEQIAQILADAEIGLTKEEIIDAIEVPSDSNMGDYAFPCFKLAKVLRKAPPMIAKDIAAKIADNAVFAKVEPVNAYVNMFISREAFMGAVIPEINKAGEHYGEQNIGNGETVIVEYSSPNICKPFHIGHIRSTVIGNGIYKLYDCLGYNARRHNHLGDYGTQFGKQIVAYRHWGSKEEVEADPIPTLLKLYTKFHVEVEEHPELDDEARQVFHDLEAGKPEEVELWQWFRTVSFGEFDKVYKMLDIEFDNMDGEAFYSDKMPAILQEMKDKGLLQESQGAQIVDLSEWNMPPALITKSDGSSLYVTRDISAAVYRYNTWKYTKNIYVVASQQNLHFQQWFKVLELMGHEEAKKCIHIPFGMVSLPEGTLSTRHGRVVFLEDVLNKAVEQTREIIKEKGVATEALEETAKAVGIGAVVFNELSNSRIKDYTFDWSKLLNFEGETGPYVQYTHARACSVLRNGGDDVAKALEKSTAGNLDAAYLTGDAAYTLAKELYDFPAVIVDAANKYEPSVLTRHIVDIAQAFNSFYHEEHILVDDENEKLAKLALVKATKDTLAKGLFLLGMKAPEKM